MKQLLFYNKSQFFNFKKEQISAGHELLSMSQFLSSLKIEELDDAAEYYVDLSSLAGFIKTNDTQMLHFEQLFNTFGDNVTFICDKIYENDIRYTLRYVFDDFADIEIEADEISTEQNDSTPEKSNQVKKIIDLNEAELKAFFQRLIPDCMVTKDLKRNLKKL